MKLSDLTGKLIYLDSNILIVAVESQEPVPILFQLFEALDKEALQAVTSELVLAEVLSKPLSRNATELVAKYQFLVHPDGPVRSLTVSRDILLLCARIRAEQPLQLADGIHVATAQSASCDYFLSEDQRLGRAMGNRPTWLTLSDLAL